MYLWQIKIPLGAFSDATPAQRYMYIYIYIDNAFIEILSNDCRLLKLVIRQIQF